MAACAVAALALVVGVTISGSSSYQSRNAPDSIGGFRGDDFGSTDATIDAETRLIRLLSQPARLPGRSKAT